METERLLCPTHRTSELRWLTRRVLLEIMPPGGVLPGLDAVDLDGFLRDFGRDAPFIMRLGLFLSVWIYLTSAPLTIFARTLAPSATHSITTLSVGRAFITSTYALVR